MSIVHPHIQHSGNVSGNVNGNVNVKGNGGRFDWAGQIKLAIVLSVVAAITAITLAGRVAEPVLIVGVIVVASFAGCARVQPTPHSERPSVRPSERQLIRIPVRHR